MAVKFLVRTRLQRKKSLACICSSTLRCYSLQADVLLFCSTVIERFRWRMIAEHKYLKVRKMRLWLAAPIFVTFWLKSQTRAGKSFTVPCWVLIEGVNCRSRHFLLFKIITPSLLFSCAVFPFYCIWSWMTSYYSNVSDVSVC